MTITVFCILLFAALLHASWNAIVKAGTDKLYSAISVSGSATVIALVLLPFSPQPSAESWPFLIVSCALQVVYTVLVAKTYQVSDMSQTYPLMRGTAPLLVDPVSTVKAEKVRPILGKLHTLKPNRMEAESLSGMKITDRASARRAAEKLLETGLERVFISLGEEGVFAADHQRDVWFPCCPAQMHSATGAGDAFAAALGWAFLEGKDLADSARAANAAAAIAVEGEKTINPALSADAVQQRMQEQEERI